MFISIERNAQNYMNNLPLHVSTIDITSPFTYKNDSFASTPKPSDQSSVGVDPAFWLTDVIVWTILQGRIYHVPVYLILEKVKYTILRSIFDLTKVK